MFNPWLWTFTTEIKPYSESWKLWHKNCFPCHVLSSVWVLDNKMHAEKFYVFSKKRRKTFNIGRGRSHCCQNYIYRFTSCPDLVACITLSFSGEDEHWNASTQQQVLALIYFISLVTFLHPLICLVTKCNTPNF